MSFNKWVVTRRDFLKVSAGAATAFILPDFSRPVDRELLARIGIVTDSHYAQIDSRNNRYYRESLDKMRECIEFMNREEIDFIVELGDFVNGAEECTLEYLHEIEEIFSKFRGARYHVLGNHDLDSLSKNQFQSVVRNFRISQEATWYSFNRNGLHVVVLDANFCADGTDYDSGNFHWADANITPEQLEWLTEDLSKTNLPVIVFVHQLLDEDEGSHYINNATEVRNVLEKFPNVLAVLQGHQHTGQYHRIGGIHYYTFIAMVEGPGAENSSYSIAEVFENGDIIITGYRRAVNRSLDAIF